MTSTSDSSRLPSNPKAGLGAAVRIVERLLQGFKVPFAVRLWNQVIHHPGQHPPAFTLVLRDPTLLRRLVMAQSPLPLADAYCRGGLDVEGDLFSAITLKSHFESMSLSWRDKFALLRDALRLPGSRTVNSATTDQAGSWLSRLGSRLAHRHTRASDQTAIAFHYDVSNAFYQLWLDEQMVYSCAYFEHADQSLDQAQRNKLEHICRKLRLQPGERFLDVGCGWGALVRWAARHHGVRAHGITLSQQQLDHARQRIRAEGLEDACTVELLDYRDLPRTPLYDKVASVGMFEHVGLANIPRYLQAMRQVLRPGGLFLNHGITHDEEGWHRTADTQFINHYVFPGGELDLLSNVQRQMERTGFEIHDVEGWRPHYARTLRHWVRRLEAQREAALREVGEATYRTWCLYMAACALEFESGRTGIYQILASRRHEGEWPVPLTRRDLYTAAPPGSP